MEVVPEETRERIEAGYAKIASSKYRKKDRFHDNPEECITWPQSGSWWPIPTLEAWGFERCGNCAGD